MRSPQNKRSVWLVCLIFGVEFFEATTLCGRVFDLRVLRVRFGGKPWENLRL